MKNIISLAIISSIFISSYTAEQGITSLQPTAIARRSPQSTTELRRMLAQDCMILSCTGVSVGFSVPFFKFLAEGDDCIEAASKATHNCILACAASVIPIAYALHLNYQKYKGILAENNAKQKTKSQKKIDSSQAKKNN